ncbi:Gfo/Idh/MocA family oxidoreductase [Rhodobacteraceae bacterium R_SAG10]|nr:Gfo/Idh/MocA family oxidoreductase [Rhodobacteraceae bacterium R_SAG10]
MKSIIQSLKDGSTEVIGIPAPNAVAGQVLVQTSTTLVSAGTERMLLEFGKGNLIQKALSHPDKVKVVLGKAKTDGVIATIEAVTSKLDQPFAPGYSNVGRVLECGKGVSGFKTGDRVVSNGKHAEIVCAPKNLCAKIPDNVSDEAAVFTVLAAIALQGIRLAKPTLGESVVVTGLGLIGLLTVQLLRAQGCRVLGIDFDPARLKLAAQFGAETVNPGAGEDVLKAAEAFSRGNGVDSVIITASTKSSEPVQQAANMCRKRGRIVLVGVVGLELNRADFYEKELSFQVSCSYGPGRYDPSYEEQGHDYPIGFVRWTEQRNFEAVLDLMASGQLDLAPLITHRFDIDDGADAMALLTAGVPSLAILLKYPGPALRESDLVRSVTLNEEPPQPRSGRVAFLGAGNYAGRVLIPAFGSAGATLGTIVSAGGVSAVHFGRKFGFARAATESQEVFDDPDIDTVVVATRHDAHAAQVLAALKANKHVFCEKPLCLTIDELEEIESESTKRPDQHLMIGFNRRFAPLVVRMKRLLQTVKMPKSFMMTVNAGDIPADHWTQNTEVGGGRIIGEACHFIDLIRHLSGAPITSHHAVAIGEHPAIDIREDKAMITLTFADGSIGVINYLANGHKSVPKERLEVFAAGRVLQLDNYLTLKGKGWSGLVRVKNFKQDKGQAACSAAFMASVRDGRPTPIPADEIFEVSRVAIEIAESIRG